MPDAKKDACISKKNSSLYISISIWIPAKYNIRISLHSIYKNT